MAGEAHVRLVEAVALARLGYFEWDLITDAVVVSEESLRILGVTGEVSPRADELAELVHPDDRAAHRSVMSRAREGRSYVHEFRIVRPDGMVRTLHTVGRAESDESGRPFRLFGIMQDITERKETEKEVALLRALLDQSLDGIEVIDWETGRFLDVNARACTTHGYTREEYLSMTVAEIDPTVAEVTWPVVREAVKIEREHVHHGRHRKKDGSEIDVEVTATYVVHGREYLLAVVRDVTERKRAERALAESQEQLRQAQKMDAVGRLAGGIAHDFNNLLTVINGNAETLLASVPPEEENHELLRDIAEAGRRGATLTRQLLAFSRKQILIPRVVDLNARLRELLQLLRRVIGEDIHVHLDEDPTIGGVELDPGQFEQAIVNLVVNARDAMPNGGRLTLTTRAVEDAVASIVTVTVTDTGCGMTEATKARIFEPFFTTKDPARGTGLGLSMVYGFVNQSGGTIDVESEVGRGTSFRLSFRSATGPLSPSAPAHAPDQANGRERVLLVEDEEGVRRLVARTLRARGYEVLEAGNGSDALALAHRCGVRIDLLVTDLVMPQMGGPELAEQLVKARLCDRALFMSGYIETPPSLTDADYLQKPFTMSELLQRVRNSLERRT